VRLEFLVPHKDIMSIKNCSITVTCKEIKTLQVSCYDIMYAYRIFNCFERKGIKDSNTLDKYNQAIHAHLNSYIYMHLHQPFVLQEEKMQWPSLTPKNLQQKSVKSFTQLSIQ
jgi:hypothetical protein